MSKKILVFIMGLILAAAVLTGCNADNGNRAGKANNADDAVITDEITLRLYQVHGSYTPDEVEKIMFDPVKKKFPNITIEFLHEGGGKPLADYITSGEIPDLFMFAHQFINDFTIHNVLADLSNLAEKHKLDLSKFNQTAIDDIRNFGSNGELYAIPYSITFSALYYNKEIFDKFGVSYPKDSMTWHEVVQLGKEVARTEDGVQYKSVDPFSARHLASVLSLPYVDPETMKAAIVSDGWQTVFNMYKEIRALPGNNERHNPINAFLADQNLAMLGNYTGMLGRIEALTNEGKMFDWDFTTYPGFPEAPGKSLGMEAHVLTVSQTTPYQDEAFMVISYLTERENQILATKNKRMTALDDQNIKMLFGENSAFLKGKNIAGVVKSEPAAQPKPFGYSPSPLMNIVNDAANEVADGLKDINTALREANEKVNQELSNMIK